MCPSGPEGLPALPAYGPGFAASTADAMQNTEDWTASLISWPHGDSWCVIGPDTRRYERFDPPGRPSQYWGFRGELIGDKRVRSLIDAAIDQARKHST